MVTVKNYLKRKKEDGTSFFVLILEGEVKVFIFYNTLKQFRMNDIKYCPNRYNYLSKLNKT